MIGFVKLAPSILSADFAHLGEQVREAEAAGADYIHIDVMDGRFVPVISMGLPIVQSLRPVTNLTFDIHLMVVEPEKHIESFLDAGGDIINVHVEAATHLHRIVQTVKSRGKRAGVSVNPGTPLSEIEEILPELDQVMLMAVNPGYSGQAFIESVLPKTRRLRKLLDEHRWGAEIEIDGGVSIGTAPGCVAAGADVLVAASAVFNKTASITDNIAKLRESVKTAGRTL